MRHVLKIEREYMRNISFEKKNAYVRVTKFSPQWIFFSQKKYRKENREATKEEEKKTIYNRGLNCYILFQIISHSGFS